MGDVISIDGYQIMTPCEPKLDELTHVQLLALLTDLVEIREAEVDPARHAALASVTSTLCLIIARHEPQEEA
ncbi:hypothetical protein [Pseudomonas oryzihabitans]|uniref:hypothetical protein n=1 Tax=Pseudomonas oryzihabitans TaxID=47885 RepID=UPI00241F8B2B|nr:hypothetical protein [Pseudomonas oryzihabitans]